MTHKNSPAQAVKEQKTTRKGLMSLAKDANAKDLKKYFAKVLKLS
jgi:hypothetical protein